MRATIEALPGRPPRRPAHDMKGGSGLSTRFRGRNHVGETYQQAGSPATSSQGVMPRLRSSRARGASGTGLLQLDVASLAEISRKTSACLHLHAMVGVKGLKQKKMPDFRPAEGLRTVWFRCFGSTGSTSPAGVVALRMHRTGWLRKTRMRHRRQLRSRVGQVPLATSLAGTGTCRLSRATALCQADSAGPRPGVAAGDGSALTSLVNLRPRLVDDR